MIVRDPDQPGEDDNPDDFVLAGSVGELAEALDAHAELGFAHAMVILDPRTPRSVERLAEAVRLSRE